jgi:hypothetical protein
MLPQEPESSDEEAARRVGAEAAADVVLAQIRAGLPPRLIDESTEYVLAAKGDHPTPVASAFYRAYSDVAHTYTNAAAGTAWTRKQRQTEVPENTPAALPDAPLREVTCIVVQCSNCGAGPTSDDDDGYTPHFAGRAQAQEILTEQYEWRITGKQWLCRACAEKADCARLGHVPITNGPTLLADGRTLGETTWCDRCGTLIGSGAPCIPAPEGYLAPESHHAYLHWDAAALPEGQAIVTAATVLLGALNAAAVTARWDAWPGDQTRRPELQLPGMNAQQAAARLIIAAAGRLPVDGAPSSCGNPGAWAAFAHQVSFWTSKADSHLTALRLAAELGGHDIHRLRQWVGDAREAEAILTLHGQFEAAALLAELRSGPAGARTAASIRLTLSLALEAEAG